MFELDENSLLVTLETHHRIAVIEKRLGELDYTLGYYSIPSNRAPLKEALAQKIPNLYALKYGEIDKLCMALSWKGRGGQIFKTRLAPRLATGPDWKALMIGNCKGSGCLQKATLKIFPLPERVMISLIGLSSLEESFNFERLLKRRELIPRLFHRFSSQDSLRRWLRHKASIGLALEWAGSLQELDAITQELETWTVHYPHRHLEKPEDLGPLMPLFRRKLPEIGWGGILPLSSDEQSLVLQKKLELLLC